MPILSNQEVQAACTAAMTYAGACWCRIGLLCAPQPHTCGKISIILEAKGALLQHSVAQLEPGALDWYTLSARQAGADTWPQESSTAMQDDCCVVVSKGKGHLPLPPT